MKKKTAPIGFVVLILCGLFGCATMGNYGTIVPDDLVMKALEACEMDPGMNYYYSGPDAYPNALIGLKKQFVLDNDLWKPVAPDPQSFRKLIQAMQDKAHDHGQFQRGFVMKDTQGQSIGVWYSILDVKMNLRMGEGNKVIVYTPELIIYKEAAGVKRKK